MSLPAVLTVPWPGYPSVIFVAVGSPTRELIYEAMVKAGCSATCRAALSVPQCGYSHVDVLPCHKAVIYFNGRDGKPESAGEIVHECFHACYGILSRFGIPLTNQTEEVWAYALEAVAGAVTKALGEAGL